MNMTFDPPTLESPHVDEHPTTHWELSPPHAEPPIEPVTAVTPPPRKRKALKIVGAVFACVALLGIGVLVGRTSTQSERDDLRAERDALTGQVDEATQVRSGLEADIEALNADMAALTTEASDLRTQVDDYTGRFADAAVCRTALDDADALVQQWYNFWSDVLAMFDTAPGSKEEATTLDHMEEQYGAMESAYMELQQQIGQCEAVLGS